jgi:hypothetical protein
MPHWGCDGNYRSLVVSARTLTCINRLANNAAMGASRLWIMGLLGPHTHLEVRNWASRCLPGSNVRTFGQIALIEVRTETAVRPPSPICLTD